MKLFYFSTISGDKTFEDIVKKSKIKPSNAPQYFETMLLKGLAEIKEIELSINSFPMISVFPGGCLFGWFRKKEKLSFGAYTTWLPAINLQFLKQICFFVSSFFSLLYWLLKNIKSKDKAVMIYSLYPPVASSLVLLRKIFKFKAIAIVPDLPLFMYSTRKPEGIKAVLGQKFANIGVMLQKSFDKYILLTTHMINAMSIEGKPNIIIEGFSDKSIFEKINIDKKEAKKTIMYAGALNENMGVLLLLEAFMQTKGDYNLWLFGAGDLENMARECEKKDKRITYFGKTDREKLLKAQMSATLLVNPKLSQNEYSKNAFPSKVLEYMTSGTPVLSTKIKGIPDEYFEFLYSFENETPKELAQKIEEVLSLPFEVLEDMGKRAKIFVDQNKNYKIQANKIFKFLQEK